MVEAFSHFCLIHIYLSHSMGYTFRQRDPRQDLLIGLWGIQRQVGPRYSTIPCRTSIRCSLWRVAVPLVAGQSMTSTSRSVISQWYSARSVSRSVLHFQYLAYDSFLAPSRTKDVSRWTGSPEADRTSLWLSAPSAKKKSVAFKYQLESCYII